MRFASAPAKLEDYKLNSQLSIIKDESFIKVVDKRTTLDESQKDSNLHDDEKRNVSNTSTLSSIICVVAGTGILAIAHAMSQSGWIGILFLILNACMSQFTGVLLIQCLYTNKNNTRFRDYADIGHMAFGKPGKLIGYIFSQSFLLLTPTVYMVMASENISILLLQNGFIWLNRKVCVWIISIMIGVPFVLVRNMKDVSFLSTFASMTTVCLLLIVCVVALSSDYLERINTVHHDIAIAKNIPLAFSTFSFSYFGHAIYPHLEASMITPERWSKVLLVSNCVVSILYFTMAFVCYLVFGNVVQSPIYKSLPLGSSQNIAMFVITIHVLLAIPFYLYIYTIRIELWFKDKQIKDSKLIQVATRISVILLCAIIAMCIPYFSDFMAVVSTMLCDILAFVLPTIFWMKLNWETRQGRLGLFLICSIIAIFGILCTLFGTIDVIQQLLTHGHII
ncbi:transmembrane amino acid transporter protein-domain-containing protein [Cokeromyces recurvatus]|uniref:transmembrane amino acid transporter protein-domain-containing protein n=1 Tax=Cokeromyces recurvatus TaxID=90255 RepID=UPI00221F2C71|nr:transmembrane amino acid transporter protein-domain-containing protein [Cokeromyces recurvatus]KAI7904197.1 transmembrane amino acid transporter protein-domain-containing protein [Cokeromyces recurvatus]